MSFCLISVLIMVRNVPHTRPDIELTQGFYPSVFATSLLSGDMTNIVNLHYYSVVFIYKTPVLRIRQPQVLDVYNVCKHIFEINIFRKTKVS